MSGMMEFIEKYLGSSQFVVRVHLAYLIRKTITIQTYDDYPKYVAPDDEMIVGMFHHFQMKRHDEQVHNQSTVIQKSMK